MLNDGYSGIEFESLAAKKLGQSVQQSTFASLSRPVDGLGRSTEVQHDPERRTRTVRDERQETLERAGYLLVVSIDRLIRVLAAVIRHIVRSHSRGHYLTYHWVR